MVVMPGLDPRLSVQLFGAARRRRRRDRHNLLFPLAGLVPAIHAFPAVHKATFEDVGGRDKPGQGDFELYRARYKQSVSLNRTAADSIRASTVVPVKPESRGLPIGQVSLKLGL
jgi:hypothetical protein